MSPGYCVGIVGLFTVYGILCISGILCKGLWALLLSLGYCVRDCGIVYCLWDNCVGIVGLFMSPGYCVGNCKM